MRATTAAVFALALSSPAVTAQDAAPPAAGRALTHEDLWTLRRLGSPVVSPDGRRVVVAVTEPAYEKDETRSDLWLLATGEGGPAPRRLTWTKGGEGGLAFRPDGAMLAFTAKRDGDDAAQVYVLPLDGPGEARRVTEAPTGASNPVWSPDGRAIAYESAVFPGISGAEATAAEAERRKGDEVQATAYDHFPVRAWDEWLDDRQTRPFVLALGADGEPDGEARDLLFDTELVAGPGYDGSGLGLAWTPDGRGLVLACATNRHEAARAETPDHLYFVPAAGGTPLRLTPDDASWSSPAFAPDGSALFALRTARSEFVYNLPRLARRPWPAAADGGWEVLAPGFDRPVDEFVPAAAGAAVCLLATEHGRRRVFALDPGTGQARLLDPTSRGVHGGLAASRDRTVLVTRWEDSSHAAEIVRVDRESGAVRPLSRFNADRTAGIDLRPFLELWFDSSRGRRIHCWLALPPGFDEARRYPLVVMMHGGPHASSLDAGHVRWSSQLLAAPGYVVLAPDYTGSVGYGEAFARAIQGDPLRTPCQEVVEAADAATAQLPFVDPDRQAALGASYGGHMANWLEAVSGERFRCLVSHAGLSSLEGQWATSDAIYHRERNLGGPPWAGNPVWREQSPSTYAADFRTPMLLSVGERDFRVPLNQTLAMWSMLERQQVPSRLLVFHTANHWIMRGPDARHFWSELHAWLARWLRP